VIASANISVFAVLSLVDRNWPDYANEFHKKYESYNSRKHQLWRFADVLPLNALVSLSIFFIIVALRAEGVIDQDNSWWVCWSPLWYLTGVYAFVLITNLTEFDGFWLFVLPALFLLVVLAFQILLILFLEGTIDRFVYCSIPLFIMEIVAMCSPCFIWV